ncbi:helix-turn-helix domain-containing protein [Aeromicrobium choanae]|uniref:DNA binding domain-containing protein, excisionase family n=1 Tax=Aeromicrobium choanae TaxID=1736691 RepID=A0A1T4Z279_9ACTN|nr:helix-turn-helix domain-containing protein [Aeromicrobium choanae]SKB07655.1 DNA binding domain-containing protein, excisionase family [Aeromicrobium choanae]
MISTTPDPLLTVPQTVEYLNGSVSERTLRRLIASGDIQSLRIGGNARRVRVSAIEDYLSRATQR